MTHRRYAILHHKLADGEHWDLLLEQDDSLATWRLAEMPTGPAVLPMTAVRIADHRKTYLDYEGPIGGDRSSVTRYDWGDLRIAETGRQRWVFHLSGRILSGRFRLTALPDDPPDHWLLVAAEPD